MVFPNMYVSVITPRRFFLETILICGSLVEYKMFTYTGAMQRTRSYVTVDLRLVDAPCDYSYDCCLDPRYIFDRRRYDPLNPKQSITHLENSKANQYRL
jgi:hypothetical protein